MPSNSTITLVTLEELKNAAKVRSTNHTYDAAMELTLEAVTAGIEDFLGRRVHSGISSALSTHPGLLETRYYCAEYTQGDAWAAARTICRTDDLLELVTLRTDDDGDSSYETTHQTSMVDLWPYNATVQGEPYTALVVKSGATGTFPVGLPRGVEITGVFGYCPTTAVLPVFRKAALMQAAMEFRAEDAPYGAQGGVDFTIEQQRAFAGAALHPFCRRMLEPYRRRVIA